MCIAVRLLMCEGWANRAYASYRMLVRERCGSHVGMMRGR
ncbi:MAG: hypothetical protein OJF49_001707 [Ktedonobacterales bacterium]|nr:MAG: hypothetical protein OJF49_001707 [Ktedonobacterales bacterium]